MALECWRVLWETGLRSSTVVALEAPRDYRRGSRELFLPREGDKAHDERVVPLTPAARKALDDAALRIVGGGKIGGSPGGRRSGPRRSA